MYSTYSAASLGPLGGFENDMVAIGLKEQAQRLQDGGAFEKALPLMLKSVALREYSHTLCLSLSELGELYLDMLKFDEAEAAAHRMLEEAHRYDAVGQTRIANEIIRDVAAEKDLGLVHGASVQLQDLQQRPQMNGEVGIVRGRLRPNGRYYVDVGSAPCLIRRQCLILAETSA